MKKKIMKSVLFIALFGLIVIVPALYITISNASLSKIDSSDSFLTQEYISFNGGKEASIFFKSVVKDNGHINSAFYYRDYSKRWWFGHKYFTSFTLDLQYSENDYQLIKTDILPLTDVSDSNDYDYYGDFLITSITSEESFYIDNYCGIFFNDEKHIIRYVFIYECDREYIDHPVRILSWNVTLNWHNVNEFNWN